MPQDIPITPDGARLQPGTTHIPNYGRIAATATAGKGTAMPSFRAVYTPDQLRDIAGYIAVTLAARKR